MNDLAASMLLGAFVFSPLVVLGPPLAPFWKWVASSSSRIGLIGFVVFVCWFIAALYSPLDGVLLGLFVPFFFLARARYEFETSREKRIFGAVAFLLTACVALLAILSDSPEWFVFFVYPLLPLFPRAFLRSTPPKVVTALLYFSPAFVIVTTFPPAWRLSASSAERIVQLFLLWYKAGTDRLIQLFYFAGAFVLVFGAIYAAMRILKRGHKETALVFVMIIMFLTVVPFHPIVNAFVFLCIIVGYMYGRRNLLSHRGSWYILLQGSIATIMFPFIYSLIENRHFYGGPGAKRYEAIAPSLSLISVPFGFLVAQFVHLPPRSRWNRR
jgi:hypothetical protein